MNANQFKIKLQELESNLENAKLQNILNAENFDLDNLKTAIKYYTDNIELVEDTDLLSTISEKINELIAHSNQSAFQVYSHKFINAANFLIKNAVKKSVDINDNLNEKDNLISEEEFSTRYDRLIEYLNSEDKECNLILETPSERKPFKVYKTKTKSLAIYAKSSEKPMVIGADRLVEVAFNRKEATYPSYEKILISKIMDNSIFDYFTKTEDEVLEMVANAVHKHSGELSDLKNKLESLQNENNELANTKEELLKILTESKNAKSEYKSAKEAAVNDAKLKASVDYWDDKSKKHKKQFYLYGGIAIFLIGLLIVVLTYSYNNLNNYTDIDNLNNMTKTSMTDNNNTFTTTEEKNDNQENPFAYIHFIGLYVLLIFASSSTVWIIRLIVKIALSNLHLSEDANERVVMIKTYLSFIQEGHGLQENDKQLIMSSIFRPSSIGIIQDESSITVADIITSIKK